MFENLKMDKDVAEESDRLGGGGVPESGIYDCAIDMAYAEESSGGAMGIFLTLATATGQQIRKTVYVTSGRAKGQKNFYLDRQQQKQYLPGFLVANSLSQLTLKKDFTELATEARTLMVYDFDAKKEVPKEKQVITELLGKQVKVGVIKQTVNKNVKNDVGEYVPTADTREEIEIDKFFHAANGCTVVELKAGLTEGGFLPQWEAKNNGVTRDRTVPVEGVMPMAAQVVGQQTTSLFPTS